MDRVVELFVLGGPFAYVDALLGLAALAVSVPALALALKTSTRQPAAMLGWGALAAVGLAALVGVVGYWAGMAQADAAIALADPRYHAELAARARGAAVAPLTIAGFMGSLPALLSISTLVVTRTRPKTA